MLGALLGDGGAILMNTDRAPLELTGYTRDADDYKVM